MKFAIVIPAHNEEAFLGGTLQSLIDQTLPPDQIIVVNDNSTDQTTKVLSNFVDKYDFIHGVDHKSKAISQPGSKVIDAFYRGFDRLSADYEVICKFDADLTFPPDYLQTIAHHFQKDPSLGIVGGFCQIEENGEWKLENLTDNDHIRGALKAYRKECFDDIGGLRKAMGWDTIDEQLARFYGWNVQTVDGLFVKHWKPTGSTYRAQNGRLQGVAFKRMRYGFLLSSIGLAKLGLKKKSFAYWSAGMTAYIRCKEEPLVTKEQGRFIRQWRWHKIKKKLF